MKPWIKITAIFAAGFLLGGAVTGLCIHHCFRHFGGHPPSSEFILKMLSHKLKLSPEQKDKVADLLKVEAPKMEALHKKSQDQFKAQRDAFNAKLKPLLNPDQQKKLEEMNARWEHRDEGKKCRFFHCAGMGPTPTDATK